MDPTRVCSASARSRCQLPNGPELFSEQLRVEIERRMGSENCSYEQLSCANKNFPDLVLHSVRAVPFLPLPAQTLFIAAIAAISTISLVANSIVVWIIVHHRVMHQRTTNRLVLNLAISDLAITAFNTVPLGLNNVLERWLFPHWLCSFAQMCGVIPFCSSVFIMVAISIDRFYAIVHPLECRPWGASGGSFCWHTTFAVWTLASACALPELFIFGIKDVLVFGANGSLEDRRVWCDVRQNMIDTNQIYNECMFVLQFLVPIIALTITYARIAVELWSGTNTPQENAQRDSVLHAKRRTAKLFALLVFSFLLLWLPFQLLFVIPINWFERWGALRGKVVLNATFLLAMSSTIVSPVIYFHMSERFRVGFARALGWLLPVRFRCSTEQYRNAFALGVPRISHVFCSNFPPQEQESRPKDSAPIQRAE